MERSKNKRFILVYVPCAFQDYTNGLLLTFYNETYTAYSNITQPHNNTVTVLTSSKYSSCKAPSVKVLDSSVTAGCHTWLTCQAVCGSRGEMRRRREDQGQIGRLLEHTGNMTGQGKARTITRKKNTQGLVPRRLHVTLLTVWQRYGEQGKFTEGKHKKGADRSRAEYRSSRAARREDRLDRRTVGKNGAEQGKEQTRQVGRADKEKAGARQTAKERRQGKPSMNHYNVN